MKLVKRNLLTYKMWRMWGRITAKQRVLPNYLIIGAQKGGTSSLTEYLWIHPRVHKAMKKEVHYFDNNYHQDLNWYRLHFPKKSRMKEGMVTGDSTPYYLFHPYVAERAAKDLPDAKIIVLLRNPVMRAYSHHQHNVVRGDENLSFEEAISSETQRIAEGIGHDYQYYSYLARGRYVEQLKIWFKYFSREKVLILNSEEMFANPNITCQQVFEFLGVGSYELSDLPIYNKGSYYDEIGESMTEKLKAYFQPYNSQLADLIGIDMGWDNE